MTCTVAWESTRGYRRDRGRQRRRIQEAHERKDKGAARVPRYFYAPDRRCYTGRVWERNDRTFLTVTAPDQPGRVFGFGLKATMDLASGKWVEVEDWDWRRPELWQLLRYGRYLADLVLAEEGRQRSGLGLIDQGHLFDPATITTPIGEP